MVEADAVGKSEGSIFVAVMAWRKGSTGVKEQGTDAQGGPRNLGDPASSVIKQRLGKPLNKEPRSAYEGADICGRDEKRAQGGTAKRRRRSAAG